MCGRNSLSAAVPVALPVLLTVTLNLQAMRTSKEDNNSSRELVIVLKVLGPEQNSGSGVYGLRAMM